MRTYYGMVEITYFTLYSTDDKNLKYKVSVEKNNESYLFAADDSNSEDKYSSEKK